MQCPKVYCPAHPYDLITNFCSDKYCLIGLCATCICSHTQQHIQKGSSPIFENIKDTYFYYNERIRHQIGKIETDKSWLNEVRQKISDKRKQVKQTLFQARKECLTLINKHFDEVEAKIENQITNEGKRNSLHCVHRLETLHTILLKQINSLQYYSQNMASTKFVEFAKQAQMQILPNSDEFHIRVSKQLKENEIYTAKVVYRKQILSELQASLKRLINLQFVLPRSGLTEDVKKNEIIRSQSLKRVSNPSIINTNHKWEDSNFHKKNFINFYPNQATSVIIPSPIHFQQMLIPISNQSEVISPKLNRGSRLSTGLKMIRQTQRQYNPNEDHSSTNSSRFSQEKENELAESKYLNLGSSFYC